ncbi:adenylate cyclase [Streptomyces sp. SID14478]|uniref:CYTH domain-containing protein n=1 Tax=Streptomyces sp. SID14478 TaxID=2706073 RepID=UPI0013DBE99D|nr:adenylate cyclase [Streptomyces sp. SID14478]NEB74307.1 adenylate cyclase [Streptomyces sp. SID14478]
MSQEIERRFLIQYPWDQKHFTASIAIRQGYLRLGDSDSREVRVREKERNFWLTVKDGSGLSRFEVEQPISPEMFEALWRLTIGRRIEKTRFILSDAERKIEIDVFRGALHGLVLAEVEFGTLEEAHAFIALPWFGPEVTEDIRYQNRNLAAQTSPPQGPLSVFSVASPG